MYGVLVEAITSIDPAGTNEFMVTARVNVSRTSAVNVDLCFLLEVMGPGLLLELLGQEFLPGFLLVRLS